MRLIISFAALLLSVTLLQLSAGAIGPLDALSGIQRGFTTTQIGVLGSAHFVGFFIGCWWAPRLIGSIGHARAFAAFASMGTIGAIGHPIYVDANVWTGLRILSGLCVAGCYTVIEAWFQAKLTNEIRGQVMGAYRVVDIAASAAAQMMIGFLEPAAFVSYNILAILSCACLLPLTLTTSKQPQTPQAPRLHPIRTLITSPLGAAGVIVAGITSASFRMVGPIYGAEVGLRADQIGYFLATILIGGALAQFPLGWLADRYDRRWVLIWLSGGGILICGLFALAHPETVGLLFVMAFLFGAITFPIFSVAAAHANDLCAPEERVELNASLMFIFGVGAIFAPLLASALIEAFGPGAMFAMISVAHILLCVLGTLRMLTQPVAEGKTRYRYMPRTSFLIGRLIRRRNLD